VGALAQARGARAVMATLWPVAEIRINLATNANFGTPA
jgi:hypothetical protein